jgi:hypothetical protein
MVDGMKDRSIRVEGDVAYVPLTKGYEAIIDAADVCLVGRHLWYAKTKPGKTVYAVRSSRTGRRTIQLHRIIMGEPEGLEVDHRDGNGLNNRRVNLRIATRAQNGKNQRTPRNNVSGFKGVYWDSRKSRWRAQITADGRTYRLGLHRNLEAAVAAYAEASKTFHGEFGRTE